MAMSGNELVKVGLSEDEFVKAAQDNQGYTKDEGVIPFTRVMQPLSPQVGTVPGVVAGGFLNLATNKFSTELLVIPVDHRWNYTQWSAPQGEGGQFMQDWGDNEQGWQELCDPDQRMAYQPVTKTGNVILKARHFYIFDIDEIGDYERSILPFYATSLKVAKQWSTMQQYAPKINTSKGMLTPAYFYYTYKITLEESKNQKGRWFSPKVTANIVDNRYVSVLELPNGKAIWDAAIALRESLKAGDVRAANQNVDEDTY